MTLPRPGVWLLKQQVSHRFISAAPLGAQTGLTLTNSPVHDGQLVPGVQLSLIPLATHLDGTRDVMLGNGSGAIYAPDDAGDIVATQVGQPWPRDAIFQMVPAPAATSTIHPRPPRGGAFFLRFRDGRHATSDATRERLHLAGGDPGAADIFVAIGAVAPAAPHELALREGEVAFYEHDSFTGAVWVFGAAYVSLFPLANSVIQPFRSLRLGPRTAVSMRSGSSYLAMVADTPALPLGLTWTDFFPWIQASGASGPRYDEVAVYPEANFGGVGRIYAAGGGRVSLDDERLLATKSVAIGVGAWATLSAGGASQEVGADLPNLVETRLRGTLDAIEIRRAPEPFTGQWALRGPNGRFWSAAGQLHAVASVREQEQFGLLDQGSGAFPAQRQVKIVTAAGGAVATDEDRLVIAPDPAQGTSFAVVPADRGRFALQTSDGRWVAREIGASGFVLTSDPGDRQLITPIKVAEHESQAGSLVEGEIALYEHPGYWGRAWVLNSQLDDLSALPEPWSGVGSARLGPNTGATLYAASGFAGDRLDLLSSAPSLTWRAAPGGVGSLDAWSLLDAQRAPFTARAALLEDFRLDAQGKTEAFTSYRTSIRVPLARPIALTLGATAAVRAQVNGTFYDLDEHEAVTLAPTWTGELNITVTASKLTTPGLKVRADSMPAGDFVVIHPDEHIHRRLADVTAAELHSQLLPGHSYDSADALARAVRSAARSVQHNYRTGAGRTLYTDRRYLGTDDILRVNEYVRSQDGRYYVILQIDGSLSVHRGSGPSDDHGVTWSSGSASGPSAGEYFAAMQLDGNFCIYRGVNWSDRGDPVWATGSNRAGDQFFAVVDDRGRFAIHQGTNPSDDRGKIWSSAGQQTRFLATNQSIKAGEILRSNNGAYFAAVDDKGILRVYQGRSATDWQAVVWSANPVSDTYGTDFFFIMQGDGNLCVYAGKEGPDPNHAGWCAKVTAPGGQFYAIVEDDGDLVIYKGASPDRDRDQEVIWSSYHTSAAAADDRLAMRVVPEGSTLARTAAPLELGWRLDFTAAGVRYQALTGPEDAALASSFAAASFVPSLRELLADVRRGAVQVTTIAATAVSNIVHPVITVGSSLLQWTAVQVTTAQQGVLHYLVDFAEAVFDWVSLILEAAGAGVKAVIDWLKDRFGWSDILATKNALAGLLDQAIALAQQNVQQLSSVVQSTIDRASGLKGMLGELRRKLSGTTVGATSEQAKDTRAQQHAEGVRSRWLLSLAFEHAASAQIARIGEITGDVLGDALRRELTARQGSFSDALHGLLIDGGLLANPRAIGGLLLNVVLDALAGLIDGGIAIAKIAASSLFAAIADALQALRALLMTELEIPLINDVYRSVTGDPQARMTILDFMALAMAVPTTIICKALTGKPPFKPAAPGAAADAAGSLALDQRAIDSCYMVLVVIWGWLDAMLDSNGFAPIVPSEELLLDEIETLVSLIALVWQLGIQIFGTPGKIADLVRRMAFAFTPTNIGPMGTSGYMQAAIWEYQWFMWLVDLWLFGWTYFTHERGKATRNIGELGPALDGAMGCVHELLFMMLFEIEAKAEAGAATTTFTELSLFAIPEMAKFLRYIATAPVIGALIAIDIGMNVASGVIHALRTLPPPALTTGPPDAAGEPRHRIPTDSISWLLERSLTQ
jgi:hypothetical protein